MANFLRRSFVVLFLIFGFLGYTYFGPSSHTHFFTKREFYQEHIGPFFEKLFSLSGENSALIAHLSSAKGDLSIRPQAELVFVPAHEGQALYSGTIVAVGDDSEAKIALIDGSILSLEPNSTILLEAPVEGASEKSITLKVIKGTIAADKEQSSKLKVRIVTSQGTEKNISAGKKMVVIAQRKVSAHEANLSKAARISRLTQKQEEGDLEELVATVKDDTDLKAIPKDLLKELNQPTPVKPTLTIPVAKVSKPDPTQVIKAESVPDITPEPVLVVKPEPVLYENILSTDNQVPTTIPGADGRRPLVTSKPKYTFLEVAPIKPLSATTDSEARLIKQAEAYANREINQAKNSHDPAQTGERKKSSSKKIALTTLSATSQSPQKTMAELALKKNVLGVDTSKEELRSPTSIDPHPNKPVALTEKGFGPSTQASLDSLIANYIRAEQCPPALATMRNVKKSHAQDFRAQRWIHRWLPRYRKVCEKPSA